MTKKQHIDAEVDLVFPFGEKPFIRADRMEIVNYSIYLDEDIGPPSKYRDLNHILKTAQEWDVIDIHINSNGGRLDSAVQIINGIENTKATVNGYLECEVDSAASLIAMKCHNLAVLPFASMLIHTATWGAINFTGRIVDSVKHNEKYIKDLMYETYIGFLTEDEINSLHRGEEMWLRADDIIKRLVARQELNAEPLLEPPKKTPVKKKPAKRTKS